MILPSMYFNSRDFLTFSIFKPQKTNNETWNKNKKPIALLKLLLEVFVKSEIVRSHKQFRIFSTAI